MEKITPKDVIHKILIFNNANGFEELEKIQDKSFLFFLYKQLEILFEIYQLGKIDKFKKFDFIFERNDNDFKNVYKFLEEEMVINESSDTTSIYILFDELLLYRTLLFAITNHFKSVLSANGITRYPYLKNEKIKEILKNDIENIDMCLSLIISPNYEIFELEKLIQKYNYPNIDLERLYLDNF